VCPIGTTIKVTSANYGNTGSAEHCGVPPASVCNNAGTLSTVQSLCNGERSCSMEAKDDVFGTACSGTKYLEIDFNCGTCTFRVELGG